MIKNKWLLNNQDVSSVKNSNILDVETKHYSECGFCKEKEEVLSVSWDIYSQWLFLLRKMEDKEWGGVLTIKDKIITEFKIPEQEVGRTECEFKEELGGEGIIHSHHSMGAFHSGQDDEHARNLYDYSIVISHQGIISTKRRKLPCGGFGYTDVKIEVIDLPNIDLSKIKDKSYITSYSEYNDSFPFGNFPKKEKEVDYIGQCNSCLRDNQILESFKIKDTDVLLCEECEKKYFNKNDEEVFTCDSCMQNFPESELNNYMQGIICDKCWEELSYSE